MRRLLLAGAAALLLGGCSASSVPGPVTSEVPSPPATVAAPTDVADPRSISIPALGVSSTLVPLGLTADGQHEVPPLSEPEQAGWFQPGPEPGEVGAAIILGHINGRGQRGVFADLGELATGDTVEVDDRTFIVYDVVRASKDAFPRDRVYGGTNAPELRLITCGGAFDRSSGNYLDNIIVFASEQP